MLARNLKLPPKNMTFVPPRDWLPRLRALVDAYPQDDLSSTEALCCRVVDDFTAGIVLHRLFYWWPKGRRLDNTIWKSDREWYAELNLSYAQMGRVRLRLSPVVDSWVERAQGAPTYHYQLRLEELVSGIAGVLRRSTIEIKLTLLDKSENGFSAESRNDSRQSRESITIQPQQHFTDERLNIFHPYQNRFSGFTSAMSAKLAEQVERIGEQKVREVLSRCDASAGRSWQYVLRALENTSGQVYIHPLFAPPPAAPVDDLHITDDMRAAWEQSEEGRMWAARLQAAKSPSARKAVQPPGEWAEAWNRAFNLLKMQMDSGSFDTWLRPARFLDYADGTFTIGVPSDVARDMLQHRLYRDIRRVLSDVVGRRVEIQFETHRPAPALMDDDELPLFKLMEMETAARDAERAWYRANFQAFGVAAYQQPSYAQIGARR